MRTTNSIQHPDGACQGESGTIVQLPARPPPGVDLAAVGKHTRTFRERLANRHDGEVIRAEGESALAELYQRVHDATPIVERVRRSVVKYYDSKGRLRRRLDVKARFVAATAAGESRARWHRGRAGGQRSRMATVEHCGHGDLAAMCSCCGQVAEAKIYCGCARLCARCTIRTANKKRARFAVAFAMTLQRAKKDGRLNRKRRGGAFSERHIVLTVPHVRCPEFEPGYPEHRKATAALRIQILWNAMKHFSRSLQRFYRGPRVDGPFGPGYPERVIGAVVYRAFEWTLGDDGMGHPHAHIWNFGPFLPEHDYHPIPSIADGKRSPHTRCKGEGCDLCRARVPRRSGLRTWWSRALAKAGVAVAPGAVIVAVRRVWAKPIEFIREVQKPNGIVYKQKSMRLRLDSAGDDVLRYLEGWCVATLDPTTGRRATDEVIAGVYCALEGKRLTQASAGFLGLADAEMVSACDCGVIAPRAVRATTWSAREAEKIAPEIDAPAATGPPGVADFDGFERRSLEAVALSKLPPRPGLVAISERLRELTEWGRELGREYRRTLGWKARS